MLTAILLACSVGACAAPPAQTHPPELRHIVFGSCLNKTEHPLLDYTLTLPMDLFIFLGDNIYADTTDMAVMRGKYDALKHSRFYRELRDKAPILATWDDHDFGVNDGGAENPFRRESQEQFLDWLDASADSPRRKQDGVYDAHILGPPGRRVQIILLDTRYFRGPLARGQHEALPSGGPYAANSDPNATMLGEAQWRWLEGELRKPAELRLIVSSIQFVAEFAGSEAWANLPLEKQRMLEAIAATRAQGVLFLSGDRHWCELSRIPAEARENPLGYAVYDLTASAMTQVHPRGTPTPNRFRFLPKTFHEANVGRLTIKWEQPDPRIKLEIIDANGIAQITHDLKLSELRPR